MDTDEHGSEKIFSQANEPYESVKLLGFTKPVYLPGLNPCSSVFIRG